MNRRNFIYNSGRYLFLAGLVSLGAFGIYKRKKIPANKCIYTDYCKECAELASCRLPQAIRQRKLMSLNSHTDNEKGQSRKQT